MGRPTLIESQRRMIQVNIRLTVEENKKATDGLFYPVDVGSGLILYGRKTYELMVPFWPEVAKDQTGSPDEIALTSVMNRNFCR
jgi:hypothetical protein